jgi:hypothetical protein
MLTKNRFDFMSKASSNIRHPLELEINFISINMDGEAIIFHDEPAE